MIVTNWTSSAILWIANLFAKDGQVFIGITIWPFVFIKAENAGNARLIMHERKHLEQFLRYWIVGFPFVYYYQVLKYGYYNAPLEVEARKAEQHAGH